MTPNEKKQPSLLRANGTSLHRQLFLVLREQIGRGAFPAGSSLPTEEALCEQFAVSRITVRRALQDLEAAGFVERRHGRGTFVREGTLPLEPAPPLTFVEGLQKTALESEVEVIESGKRLAPPPIAALLDLPSGDEAFYALRLRRSGELPLMVTEAWLPARFAKIATPAALRKHALYEILLDDGIRFGRVLQEVSAEAADPLRARLLETAIGAPLLRITRMVHDSAAKPIQHLTVHLSPERSRILMDIPAKNVDSLSAGYVAHDVLSALRTSIAPQARSARRRHAR